MLRPDPEHDEAAGIAIAQDITRIARQLGESVLEPPRCALASVIGDETNARGAPAPSVAKSSLTRDARRKARRQRQDQLEEFRLEIFGARFA